MAGDLWKANVLRYVAGLIGAGVATDEWNRADSTGAACSSTTPCLPHA